MNVTLYDIASRFIGLKDVPGPISNPQVLAMLRLDDQWPENDEVPWCSAAMNYWCWLLRMPRSHSLMARSWLDVGTPISLGQARADADVVVFWRGSPGSPSGHVALYSGIDDKDPNFVQVLGGNQGNSVRVSPMPIDRILGVRRLN